MVRAAHPNPCLDMDSDQHEAVSIRKQHLSSHRVHHNCKLMLHPLLNQDSRKSMLKGPHFKHMVRLCLSIHLLHSPPLYYALQGKLQGVTIVPRSMPKTVTASLAIKAGTLTGVLCLFHMGQ